ncbi:HEAT repeat protein [Bremerella volcania]|uniref:HEAT repeat protein n=1 Tax=Bremerella volcania TaxID=2527984 RepID=A0A518CFF4_9BACT|nr:HEAT repeat domain-containing protein [Bremerella volcania]QDU77947.1 HEAT repeat protein [Bremerella volcania]
MIRPATLFALAVLTAATWHSVAIAEDAPKPSVEALVEATASEDATVRREAIAKLVELQPGADVTIPLFTKLLEDSDPAVRLRVMNAIADAGPAAVPGLIEALKNDKAAFWACLILRELGPQAADAAPALAGLVENGQGEIRREALLALASMPKAAESYLPLITKSLADEQLEIAAIYTLGCIGKLPQEAADRLQANARGEGLLSLVSLWALARSNPADQELNKQAIQRLAAGLNSKYPLVRAMASQGLVSLKAPPALLKEALKDDLSMADVPVVRNALNVLASMGPDAIELLTEALKHPSVQYDAILIIGDMGPKGAPATSAVAKLIDSDNLRVANEAVVTLGKIGPAAKSAVPQLTKALEKGQGSIAHNAALALGRIGPDAKAAQPNLIQAMQDAEDPGLRMLCAWALVHIDAGSQATQKAVAPIVDEAAKSDNPVLKKAADELLAKMKGAGN